MPEPHAGSSTRYRVLDSDQKTELWNGYGEQDIALPLGSYFLEISGSSEPIKIAAKTVVRFTVASASFSALIDHTIVDGVVNLVGRTGVRLARVSDWIDRGAPTRPW